ncbi:MAG: AAA family ATPase [Frankiaceae bacterium]|jgi:anion-transporting  ArsA/GET3 family ATPase|nr:AAA family ATPase [Frankiaceae bacterium]
MSERETRWDVPGLLRDPSTRIVVACGSGGVGKTTTAAALGLLAARAGRRTVVLTIDPARRLAQSLGLGELDNTPRRVDEACADLPAAPGPDGAGPGELFAMMLDMKRTFDEVVSAHASPERAAQIFANPFYQSLSSSFAGTQEYMAMEKLSQLRLADEWDLIVVDTPPSRSALDFLDAPGRLGRFLDGRMIRLLSGPARVGGKAYLRVMSASMRVFSGVLDRVIGGDLLRDVSAFVAAMETMFGGFRERAQLTYQLLKAPGTAFVVVATAQTAALREASYFIERLDAERMPVAGLVVNRVQPGAAHELTAARAAAAAGMLRGRDAAPGPDRPGGGAAERSADLLAAAALAAHAEAAAARAAQQRLIRRMGAAHPGLPMIQVPALPTDVHDLAGLRRVGAALSGAAESTPR